MFLCKGEKTPPGQGLISAALTEQPPCPSAKSFRHNRRHVTIVLQEKKD
jgi:hypothetical protein